MRYYLSSWEPDDAAGLFTVRETSGQVMVAAPLDRETVPEIQLNVTARDSAVIPRETSRILTIILTVSDTQLIAAIQKNTVITHETHTFLTTFSHQKLGCTLSVRAFYAWLKRKDILASCLKD